MWHSILGNLGTDGYAIALALPTLLPEPEQVTLATSMPALMLADVKHHAVLFVAILQCSKDRNFHVASALRRRSMLWMPARRRQPGRG